MVLLFICSVELVVLILDSGVDDFLVCFFEVIEFIVCVNVFIWCLVLVVSWCMIEYVGFFLNCEFI